MNKVFSWLTTEIIGLFQIDQEKHGSWSDWPRILWVYSRLTKHIMSLLQIDFWRNGSFLEWPQISWVFNYGFIPDWPGVSWVFSRYTTVGMCPFGGRDGGLWEWPDLSCHSLVGSFKIEFFFFVIEPQKQRLRKIKPQRQRLHMIKPQRPPPQDWTTNPTPLQDWTAFFVVWICIQLGRWWILCLHQNHRNKQPFTFSISWIYSSWLTSTHKRERRKHTALLREHGGGLLPCLSKRNLCIWNIC
jgi:hypothetical protein